MWEKIQLVWVAIILISYKEITIYPAKVRTVIFWVMNSAAMIVAVTLVVLAKNKMPWGGVALIIAVASLGFWLAENYPKHPMALVQRRGIISVWEDYILMLDCVILLAGFFVSYTVF